MAKAPDYTKATDFSTEELNLASGRSTLNNAKLDTELENLGAAFNALNANE